MFLLVYIFANKRIDFVDTRRNNLCRQL